MITIEGILSNWDSLEAEIREGLSLDYGKSKNLQDVLAIIHELQLYAGTLSPLRTLLHEHIADVNNPHQASIDLDVMSALYSQYQTLYGGGLTQQEFYDLFLNLRSFATRTDVDQGINQDAATTIDVLNYVLELHDDDPDAHSGSFAQSLRNELPGDPLVGPPSLVLDLTFSSFDDWEVERYGGEITPWDRSSYMYRHDIDGKIKQIPNNEIAIDYLYGQPSIAVFSAKTNIIPYSKELMTATFLGGSKITDTGPFILSPTDDTEYLMFRESGGNGKHGITVPIDTSISGFDTSVMNYSIYVFPVDRRQIQISVTTTDTPLVCKFNLDEEDVISDSPLCVASIMPLPSGWYRLSVGIKYSALPSEVYITDIEVVFMKKVTGQIFGDAEYIGDAAIVPGVFFQHQLTGGALPVPPIFTDDGPVRCEESRIKYPLNGIFNQNQGTFYLKYISPMSDIFETSTTQLKVFGVDDTGVLDIRSEPYSDITRIVSANDNNDVLSVMRSNPLPTQVEDGIEVKRIAFTYAIGYQGFAVSDQVPETFRLTYTNEPPYSPFSVVNQVDPTIDSVATLVPTGELIDEYNVDATDYLYDNMMANASYLVLGSGTTEASIEGYVLGFRYYPHFSNKLNLEFLMDQYVS